MNKKKIKNNVNPQYFLGIAHRGLHNNFITENSLSAFKNAIENNIAFELDIHLTKDYKLVVCHDSNLKRVTNKDGIIEELLLSEIKNNYLLINNEQIPTLNEVLKLNNEKVPIVIEIKTNHNYKKIIKELKKELQNIKDKSKIQLISFDPRTLLYYTKCPFLKGLLVSENKLKMLKLRHFFDYIDVPIALINNKKVIDFRNNGNLVNVYTIKNENELQNIKNKVDMFTFENIDISIIKNYNLN